MKFEEIELYQAYYVKYVGGVVSSYEGKVIVLAKNPPIRTGYSCNYPENTIRAICLDGKEGCFGPECFVEKCDNPEVQNLSSIPTMDMIVELHKRNILVDF